MMNRDEIFDVVKGSVSRVIPGYRGPIFESFGLRELGGHSLQGAEIATLSMQQLKIEVPQKQLLGVRDFAGLLDLFEQALGSR